MTEQHQQGQPRRPVPPRPPGRGTRKKRSIMMPLLIIGFLGFIFVAFLGVLFLFFLFKEPAPATVSRSTVLSLKIEGQISEYAPPGPFEAFLNRPVFHLTDYLDLIHKAQRDPKIKGMLLQVGITSLGWAQVEELRSALLSFQESGKWIVATGGLWQEREYFLASLADEVYMSSQGVLNLDGFMASTSFYGDLFKKYGIGVHVEAYGEYKSMADGYRYNEMTEPVREMMSALLESRERVFIETVARDRSLSPEAVKALLDTSVFEVEAGIELGLLDGALYRDEINALLTKKMDGGALNLLDHDQYWRPSHQTGSGEGVAVIFASGTIRSGDADRGLFGGSLIAADSFIASLKAARENSGTRAIVIRIDSPGGEVLASDEIWREIMLTRDKGIPVIASMGSVAASGGYYMAMACDEILAQPTTITGSIGVVSMRFDFEKLYEQFLVNVEVVKTSPAADFFTPSRALTEGEIQAFHERTLNSYRSFVTKAASCRNLEYNDLERVARGRVWSGSDALDHKLIDQLGGLEDAIKVAAEKAKLQDYQVIRYPMQDTTWNFLPGGGLNAKNEGLDSLTSLIPEDVRFLGDLSSQDNRFQLYAICPFHLDID